MIRLIIGAVAGFVSGYAMSKMVSDKEQKSPAGESYASLYQNAQLEINKLRSQIKQRDTQIEELNSKVKSLTKTLREKEDLSDDRSDDLNDLKRTMVRLQKENNTLKEELNEYKMLYNASRQEIDNLNNK